MITTRFRLALRAAAFAALCVAFPFLSVAEPKITLLGSPAGTDPGEPVARLVSRGRTIQLIVQPGARALLDPTSIAVTWLGQPIPAVAYYLDPQFAIVIAVADGTVAGGPGELAVRGTLLDGAGEFSRTIAVPAIVPSGDQPEKTATSSRQIRVVDGKGAPVAGAFVFGQQRADLLTRTDARGRATLDAITRGTPDPHWAWADGTWAEPFDPRTSPTVQLTAAPPELAGRLVVPQHDAPGFKWARAARPDGSPIAGALVWMDRTWWTRTDDDGLFAVRFRPGRTDSDATFLAPGCIPVTVKATGADAAHPAPVSVPMRPRPAAQ